MTFIQDSLTNQNLSVLQQYVGQLPGWVKEASMQDLQQEVPAKLFAYQGKRFPCSTKLATFLSRLYFEIQRDDLNHTVQRDIDAKLSSFESQWGISQAEIDASIADIQANLAVPGIQAVSQQLVNKVASGTVIPCGELVRACRELVDQGSENPVIHKYAMYEPLAGVPAFMRDLATRYGTEDDIAAAAKLSKLSHRQIQTKIAEFLDRFDAKLLTPKILDRRLSGLAKQASFDVLIAGCHYPRERVVGALSKIAAVVGVPVTCGDFEIPAADWETKLAGLDLANQRRVQDLL